MVTTELLGSIGEIRPADWDPLAAGCDLDSGKPYLLFREYLEPGPPFVLAAWRGGQLGGVLHGVVTTPRTGLFSHPWKLLTDDRMLRADSPEAGAGLRGQRCDLVRAVTSGETGWQGLSGSVGEVIVVRGFDRSRLITRPGAGPGEQEQISAGLLSGAMRAVRAGRAGAIAFPFVDSADSGLRTALAKAGFRCGAIAAASAFDLRGCTSYQAYLARLPARTRARYRREEREFEASGLRAETISLRDNAERIVELEAQTITRHGGQPDRAAMLAARHFLGMAMPGSVRVAAVRRAGALLACEITILDAATCCAVSYGCDYTTGQGSIGYHQLCFYDPIAYCCDNGISELRMGFEAVLPKRIRGAVVSPREMWLWAPDPAVRGALGTLLDFLTARTLRYLRQFRP
jgi:Peptidogalycan biosysnthesis/recognition